MIGELMISEYNENLVALMTSNGDSKVKSAILVTLGKLKYEHIETIVKLGMEDESREVRTTALGLLDQLDISKENLPSIVRPIFKKWKYQRTTKGIECIRRHASYKCCGRIGGIIRSTY